MGEALAFVYGARSASLRISRLAPPRGPPDRKTPMTASPKTAEYDAPPTFIIGTGRCGSTLMSNLVHLHPDILSLSEVFTSLTTGAFFHRRPTGEQFWKLIASPSPMLTVAINPTHAPVEFLYPLGPEAAFTLDDLPACLHMTLPHISDAPDALFSEMEPHVRGAPRAPLADHYQNWFDYLARRHGKTMWIERTGNSLTMAKALMRTFPSAKFVHIHRDTREVAMSIRAFHPMRVYTHLWSRLRPFGINILKSPHRMFDSRLMHAAAPAAIGIVDTERLLDTPPDLGVVGRFVSEMIEVGLKDLAALPPERLHTMSYADLVERPRETLEAFIEFAAPGLEHGEWLDAAEKLPRKSKPKWLALPQEEQDRLNAACRRGLDLLGYR